MEDAGTLSRRRTRHTHPLRLWAGLLALALLASPLAARKGHDDFDDAFDDHGRRGRHDDDFDRHGRRGRHHDEVFGHHHHRGAWWGDFRGRGVEFEAWVVGVDPAARILVLESGDALFVPLDTPFHPDGDLFAFEHVADFVAAGVPVELEGIAVRDADGPWIAAAIKAEDDR